MWGHGGLNGFHNLFEKYRNNFCEPFGIRLLDSTFNPAHIHTNWAGLAGKSQTAPMIFYLFLLFEKDHSWDVKTNETHALTFLSDIILASAGVGGYCWKQGYLRLLLAELQNTKVRMQIGKFMYCFDCIICSKRLKC